jgi:hypothetical protein
VAGNVGPDNGMTRDWHSAFLARLTRLGTVGRQIYISQLRAAASQKLKLVPSSARINGVEIDVARAHGRS